MERDLDRSVGLPEPPDLHGPVDRKSIRADAVRLADRKEPRMLVLSRQRDETIMIGDDVEITIVDIRGDKVRIGITAPAHIPVHRKEVYEAIKAENRAASAM